MGCPPQPSSSTLRRFSETILFLDSYFYLVVFHGTTIAQWREKGCASLACITQMHLSEGCRPATVADVMLSKVVILVCEAPVRYSMQENRALT
jgi:hypothetical protein